MISSLATALENLKLRENKANKTLQNIKVERGILDYFKRICDSITEESEDPISIELTLPSDLFILCKRKTDTEQTTDSYDNNIGITGISLSKFYGGLLLDIIYFSAEDGEDLIDCIEAYKMPDATKTIAQYIEKYPNLFSINRNEK